MPIARPIIIARIGAVPDTSMNPANERDAHHRDADAEQGGHQRQAHRDRPNRTTNSSTIDGDAETDQLRRVPRLLAGGADHVAAELDLHAGRLADRRRLLEGRDLLLGHLPRRRRYT